MHAKGCSYRYYPNFRIYVILEEKYDSSDIHAFPFKMKDEAFVNLAAKRRKSLFFVDSSSRSSNRL